MRYLFKVYFDNGKTAEFRGTRSLYDRKNGSFSIYDREYLVASFAFNKIAGYSVENIEVRV
jgi:hypothetical protein